MNRKTFLHIAMVSALLASPIMEAQAGKSSFGSGSRPSASASAKPSQERSSSFGGGSRGYSDSTVMARARQQAVTPAPSPRSSSTLVPAPSRTPQPTLVPAPASRAPAYATPIYQGRNAQPYPGPTGIQKGYSGTAIAGAAVAGVVAGAVINEALDSDTPVQQAPAPVYQAPVQQAPAPVYQAPVQQAPAPVYQAPVQQAPAPVYQAPVQQAPVQQAPKDSGMGFGTVLLIGVLGLGGYALYRVMSSKPTARMSLAPQNTASASNTMTSSVNNQSAHPLSSGQHQQVQQMVRNAENMFRTIKTAHAMADMTVLSQELSTSLQGAMEDELSGLAPSTSFKIRSLQQPQLIDARVNDSGDLIASIRYVWSESDEDGYRDNDAVWFFIYNTIQDKWQLHGFEEV